MSEKRPEDLEREELDQAEGEELPDREAMSIIEPFGGTYTLPVEPPETS